ncbi:MAG: RidA family protein [Thermomicrobiales bacterium]
MTPEEKLKEMGFELKEQKPFHPAVAMGKITGNLLYLSGSTPPPVDGVPWDNRVDDVYTVEQGYEAARASGVHAVAGGLERAGRSVAHQADRESAGHGQLPRFRDTPAVMHGFSETLYAVLGETGVHTRSPVGVQALPSNVQSEVEDVRDRVRKAKPEMRSLQGSLIPSISLELFGGVHVHRRRRYSCE